MPISSKRVSLVATPVRRQAFANDLQREFAARDRARPGVENLALAMEPSKADRDFQLSVRAVPARLTRTRSGATSATVTCVKSAITWG